ncbi:hypothetical protein ACFL0L_04540, partial [Patescibacteria group bacterium]
YDVSGRSAFDEITVTVDNPDDPPGSCEPTECPFGNTAICPGGCCAQNVCIDPGVGENLVCFDGSWETACGNGICNTDCDEQILCPADCAGVPHCGDGIVQPIIGEICDGNAFAGKACNDLNGNGVLNEAGDFYCGNLGCNMIAADPNRCQELITAACIAGSCGDGSIQVACGEECEIPGQCPVASSPFDSCSAPPTCPTGAPGQCDCNWALDCSGGSCAPGSVDYCSLCTVVTGNCTGCNDGTACELAGVGGTCQGGVCNVPCANDECRNGGLCTAQSDATCGRNGVVCVDCTAQGKICDTATGNCIDVCAANQCRDAANNCQVSSDATCGLNGNACVNCLIQGKVCVNGICLNQCAANQCRDAGGNCQNQTNTTCGLNGVACQNCAIQGKICLNGACVGACAANECRDAANNCQSQTNTTCGLNGVACQNCAAIGQVCLNGACVPACAANQCRDAGGICRNSANATCGLNGAACQDCTATGGVCVNGVCVGACLATQCRDAGGICRNQTNATCGLNGAACVNCTAQGKICLGGVCVNACAATQCRDAANICRNQTDTTCGLNGVACQNCIALGRICVNGTCVPSCAADQCRNSVTLMCTAQTNTTCGRNGADCTDCTASGKICNTVTGLCVSPCGNGSIDPGEDCDGANLNGQSCVTRGFVTGTLGCYPQGSASECEFDETFCGECNLGETRCVSPPPLFQTEHCAQVGANLAWEKDLDTEPDDRPALPGEQFHGNCYAAMACDRDTWRSCGGPPGEEYCGGTFPLNCTLACKAAWPNAYATYCPGGGCAGAPDGDNCVTATNRNGMCVSGVCRQYDYKIELVWDSSDGSPNDLDLYMFVENLGITYSGNPVSVGGAQFVGGDNQSGGAPASEWILINTPINTIRYGVYVKNDSGGLWPNNNPRVWMNHHSDLSAFYMFQRPDPICGSYPWWQVNRVDDFSLPLVRIHERMMKDGLPDGVTLNASTANMDRLNDPYKGGINYCCSADIQCMSTCNLGTHKCDAGCPDGKCTIPPESHLICPADCGLSWCEAYCIERYGVSMVVDGFCTGGATTCANGPVSPNKSECVTNDNDQGCAGVSDCCCLISSGAGCL